MRCHFDMLVIAPPHTLFFLMVLPSGLLANVSCHLPCPQIESMMLKLQRLQQKAILDDDYDAGELFDQLLL